MEGRTGGRMVGWMLHAYASHRAVSEPSAESGSAPARSSRRQCARFVDDMINHSIDHWTTTCYDKYQRCWLGIM